MSLAKSLNGGGGKLLSGVGYMEHMGKTAWSNKYCMDQATWTASGNAVETAANGDEIRVQTSLQIIWTSPSGGNWIETETVVGGTGTFAAATGLSHSSGMFAFTSPTMAVWEGTNDGYALLLTRSIACLVFSFTQRGGAQLGSFIGACRQLRSGDDPTGSDPFDHIAPPETGPPPMAAKAGCWQEKRNFEKGSIPECQAGRRNYLHIISG
jgi:hypothetical protein